MKKPDLSGLKLPDLSGLKLPDLSGIKMPDKGFFDTKMIILLAGGLALHFILAGAFIFQRGSARNSHIQELQALQAKWEDEDKDRHQKQENELISKYGANPFDRIAADPRKNIQLALQKLFKAVLDPEYTVDVSVDRFSEFKIMITTGNLPEPLKMAPILKEVFSRLDPKLASEIVFTDSDHFWIMEPYQFHSVDWKNATPEQIVNSCFRGTDQYVRK